MFGALVTALLVAAVVATGLFSDHKSGGLTANVGAGPAHTGPVPGSSTVDQGPSGSVVKVSLTDKGGPTGQGDGPYSGDAMGLSTDHATVSHGPVSFMVTNAGSVEHEVLILPLTDSQAVGTRPFGGDAKVDEAGRVGEESHAEPKATSSMTVTLAPGRYELVCNHAGHYVSGMYNQLTVT
jgi:uncharacterized cupredoxin-like copper-binding protein